MKKLQFIQAIDDHKGIIRSLCNIYYASYEDQQDAFQDIVFQLWRSFDTFRGEAKLSTWIYKVGLNTILTKKRKDKNSIQLKSIDKPHLNISSPKADDHLELFQLIIQSLKDIDKAILVLYLEGYRNKEIAEIMKISPSNVATRINRIKNQLTKKFNNKSYATK